MKVGKDFFEWAFVCVFIVVLGYLGVGAILDHRVVHPYPYALAASDAFGDVAFAEGVVDLGSYKVIPSHIRAGFDDTIGFHMPVFYHLVANVSIAAGIPVWDSDVIIGTLFSLIMVLVMYLIIREYNRNIALLSLPLTLFLYMGPFRIIYTWGVWDFVVGSTLMLVSMYLLSKLEQPFAWILLAITSSGAALSHITEAFFFFLYVIIYTGLQFLFGKLSREFLKRLVWSGLLSLAMSMYYLIIFKYGYGKGGSDWSIRYQAPERFDVIFSHFGWVSVVLLLGIVAWCILILKKKSETALMVAPFMLFIGYTNFLVSWASRAFQTRYLWPVYLSLFFGLCLYMALKMVISDWKLWQSIALSTVVILVFGVQFYEQPSSGGLMDAGHWQLFEWVKKSTQPQEKLLYFYGDPYSQEAILWLQKRVSYRVDMGDFIAAIQNRKINQHYEISVAAADDTGLMYRKGWMSFGYHADTLNLSEYGGKMDMCSFDYFVFDRVGSQQGLVQYNSLIANELLNNSAKVVFVNNEAVVLKNEKKGGTCIEDKTF